MTSYTPTFLTSFPLTTPHTFHTTALSPRRPRTLHTPRAVYTPERTQFGGQTTPTETYTVTIQENGRSRPREIQVDRDTNLRKAMKDNKIDIYTIGGKLRNCGGAGQCGTCMISVEDGAYSTNGKAPKEEIMLKDRPDNWRLACRTLIHGDCTIRTKPQA